MQGEQVAKVLVEFIGPKRRLACNTDELHGDPDSVAGPQYPSFKHVIRLQFFAGSDTALVVVDILQHSARGPDNELSDVADFGDQGVGQTQSEMLVRVVWADRVERQHGDRRSEGLELPGRRFR